MDYERGGAQQVIADWNSDKGEGLKFSGVVLEYTCHVLNNFTVPVFCY